ncbi:hypothetical protein IGI04_018870 [Brassica rapa subsp. trilocularis]|uniref:Uncharacterized protein n=1 Tax=Brassica rapa subsp. trilocularis TaxID=1813537 RepID=A0ABQ7MHN0_BRACM|nr:hypothetical protein IGI04_018870 [Brassica rapa subsp. trilocularis]
MLFTLPKQSPNQHTKPHGLSVSYAAACGVPLTTEEIKIYDNIPPCSKTISDYVLHKIGNGLALYEPLMDQIHTYKKNLCTTKRALARKIQVKLIRDRAELEGRELTMYEIDVAFDLKDAIYWAPPTQLEDIATHLNSQLLINECLDLICETRKLDDLRVKTLARIHLEVFFDKNYFN